MKFTLNPRTFMSHLVLKNRGLATQISETDQWKGGEEMEAKLEINGVEVPAEHLESFFQHMWDKSNKQHREEYDADNFDRKVEDRAHQILKEHSDNALEKIDNLVNLLSDPRNIIKPEWER